MLILSLQNTLIMVNAKDGGAEMLTLSAVTSAAVMVVCLVLSILAIIKGISGIRGGK